MKKALFIILPIILAVGIYFLMPDKAADEPLDVDEENIIVVETKTPDIKKVDAPKKEDKVEIIENSGKKDPIADKPAEFDEPQREPFEKFDENRLSDEEIEELEEYFEKVENEWQQEVENLLQGELSLPAQTVEDYHKLREAYDQEKIEAFQEFHEYMEEKYGEGYSFTPNQDMEAFENKVLDVYQDRLRQLLGDSSYEQYKRLKERYNSKLKGEQDPEKGVMLIEF